MKKYLLLLSALFALSSQATTEIFVNNEGCHVEKETRSNGMVLYVRQNDKMTVLGLGHDRSFANFTHCAQNSIQVQSIDFDTETQTRISCEAHDNGHARSKGEAMIGFTGEDIRFVQVSGYIDGLFGWKKDLNINCFNMKKL